MNNSLKIIIFSLLWLPMISQTDCPSLLDSKSQLNNEYRQSTIHTLSHLNFNVPKPGVFYDGDGHTTLFDLGFARGIWAGGYSPSGDLKVVASAYNNSGSDYASGPIWNGFQNQEGLCDFYRRVWTIKNSEIATLKYLFDSSELALEDIPLDILEWPAKGNPYIGSFAPNYDMAPFYDMNEDGNYDPMDGDHPLALQENSLFFPSEMRFYVSNDNTTHKETRGDPLFMEFHVLDYVVNCTERTESSTSIFTRLKYINKGATELREFRIGIFDDPNMGCFLDDFVGCLPELNAFFTYNEDGKDETNFGCNELITIPKDYGLVRSTIFLNQSLISFIVLHNRGDLGFSLITGPQSYYNLLDAKWTSNIPLTRGGTGYNLGSNDTTSYAFDALPIDLNGWSMHDSLFTANFIDAKTVSVFGSEPVLLSGEVRSVDFVDHVLLDQEKTRLNVFEDYEDKINQVKQDFEAMKNDRHECGRLPVLCASDCVWPGDVNDDGYVSGKDLVLLGNYLAMGGGSGPNRIPRSSDWFPYSASDWNLELFGLNNKYADVDGNGEIAFLDMIRANTNLGENKGVSYPNDVLSEGDGTCLFFGDTRQDNMIDVPNAGYFRRLLNLELRLGSLDEESLEESVHGLTYEIRFDTNLVAIDEFPITLNSSHFDQSEVYTEPGVTYIDSIETFSGINKIQFYMTNVDGETQDTSIVLPSWSLIVRKDAKTNNPDRRDTLIVKLFNVFGTNAVGEELSFGAKYYPIILTNLIYDPDLISGVSDNQKQNSELILQPNPTSDFIDIQLNEVKSGEFMIHTIDGIKVFSKSFMQKNNLRIPVQHLQSGLYIISYRKSDGQVISDRFIKI